MIQAHELIRQTLELAVENLHAVACGIDPAALNDEGRQKRLTHLETMMTLIAMMTMIAKHAPPDLRTLIACDQCRSAVASFRAYA